MGPAKAATADPVAGSSSIPISGAYMGGNARRPASGGAPISRFRAMTGQAAAGSADRVTGRARLLHLHRGIHVPGVAMHPPGSVGTLAPDLDRLAPEGLLVARTRPEGERDHPIGMVAEDNRLLRRNLQ